MLHVTIVWSFNCCIISHCIYNSCFSIIDGHLFLILTFKDKVAMDILKHVYGGEKPSFLFGLYARVRIVKS